MASDFETVIAKCDGCKYEEECREMPPCILDAYNKGRADAINNFVVNAITEFQKFDKEHGYPTLGDVSVILSDVAKQLKEQTK